ncbi:hypothetical protein GCM10010094_43810 [Streptomyces flaveus]|uniref:Uncharacterized protein n=1 Tax=Streptomyces flaveus TaxID=66370 RepID=A0A917QZT7_9ACTN|nr:hypothetical protein GCM10010094_43810 [Streptomyces flaveus]
MVRGVFAHERWGSGWGSRASLASAATGLAYLGLHCAKALLGGGVGAAAPVPAEPAAQPPSRVRIT